MPAISFSATEILPSLLDKSKTQTIRPAFRLVRLSGKPVKLDGKVVGKVLGPKHITEEEAVKWAGLHYEPPKPRYRVRDICKVYWKQRTSPKGSWFWKINGVLTDNVGDTESKTGRMMFPKLMGEVEITGVFKIEMGKKHIEIIDYAREEGTLNLIKSVGYNLLCVKDKLGIAVLDIISRNDGFKSVDQMFEFFNKTYDLTTPKMFWVYRWSWI